jgi:hypothetical protein
LPFADSQRSRLAGPPKLSVNQESASLHSYNLLEAMNS